jgi:hypothetical protein
MRLKWDNIGKGIAAWGDAIKQRELYDLQEESIKESERIANESNLAPEMVSTGEINRNDIGLGGGLMGFKNASDADAAYHTAQDIESLQNEVPARSAGSVKPRDDGQFDVSNGQETRTYATKAEADAAYAEAFRSLTEPSKRDTQAVPAKPAGAPQNAATDGKIVTTPLLDREEIIPLEQQANVPTPGDVVNAYNELVAAGKLREATALRKSSGGMAGLDKWAALTDAKAAKDWARKVVDPSLPPNVPPVGESSPVQTTAQPTEQQAPTQQAATQQVPTQQAPAQQSPADSRASGLRRFTKPKIDAMDVYAKRYVPKIQQVLFKQNRFKEAEAFGEWAKQRDNAQFGEAYSTAGMMIAMGDKKGAVQYVSNMYNRLIPDGQMSEVSVADDGMFDIQVRDEKTGKRLHSTRATADQILGFAMAKMDPYAKFKAEQEAKMKTHDVAPGHNLVRDGQVVYTNPAAQTSSTSPKGKLIAERQDAKRQLELAKASGDKAEIARWQSIVNDYEEAWKSDMSSNRGTNVHVYQGSKTENVTYDPKTAATQKNTTGPKGNESSRIVDADLINRQFEKFGPTVDAYLKYFDQKFVGANRQALRLALLKRASEHMPTNIAADPMLHIEEHKVAMGDIAAKYINSLPYKTEAEKTRRDNLFKQFLEQGIVFRTAK